MANATAYLSERLGIEPVDRPEGLQGILATEDYHTFQILSDVGDVLHEFQGAKLANRCLPGDHVRWTDRCVLELSDEHPPLVGTLHLTSPQRYGFTRRKIPLYLFTPYDTRYPPMIVGSAERDHSVNRLCTVTVGGWEGTYPRGLLQQMIGRAGDVDAERAALTWLAAPYPRLPSTAPVCQESEAEELGGFTFHVDPAGCRDVDDVLTVERTEDGWRVSITISDVAAYVEENSPVDIMASLMTQTIYDTNGRILRSMLPESYESACSLLPGHTHHGVTLSYRWDGRQLSDAVWRLTTFRVQQSYTYEEFQRVETEGRQVIQAVASYVAGGTVEDAHDWIAQLMILYNREAGAKLRRAGAGIVRRHAPADLERMEIYRQHLPDGMAHLAARAAEYTLATDADTAHSGLACQVYAHATSPIRRYVDLVNQRVLKELILLRQERLPYTWVEPVTIRELNRRERVIRRVDRDRQFLEAVAAGRTTVEGWLVEATDSQESQDSQCRLTWYVPEWKKRVSATYRRAGDNEVWSKDDQEVRRFELYRPVELQCAVQWGMRSWRERVVIQWR
jgi:exoribonuclease R